MDHDELRRHPQRQMCLDNRFVVKNACPHAESRHEAKGGMRFGNHHRGIDNVTRHHGYLNHLGTVHASALIALAETSGGEFLLRTAGSIADVVPVVRRLEAKFRKGANGAITPTVSTPSGALDQWRADLAAKGRAMIRIAVELHDQSGAHTLSAAVEWFVTRVPDSTRHSEHPCSEQPLAVGSSVPVELDFASFRRCA